MAECGQSFKPVSTPSSTSAIGRKPSASTETKWRYAVDTQLRRQGAAQFSPGIRNPGQVQFKRCDSREPAAPIGQFWAGGPADHAIDHALAVAFFIDRAAGVAGAGAEPGHLPFGGRVEQPELQVARLAGGDEIGAAEHGSAAVVARGGDAV